MLETTTRVLRHTATSLWIEAGGTHRPYRAP